MTTLSNPDLATSGERVNSIVAEVFQAATSPWSAFWAS